MTETTHLALPYLAAAQAQKHVTHNEALTRLDAVVQLAVLDSTLTAPPGSPGEGERYLVATGASDAWEDHDGEVAAFVDGAWLFLMPGEGWIAFDIEGEAVLVRHDGDWVAIGTFLGPIARLGVHTIADDTNRLAVRSAAALFTALEASEGGSGDLRLVANKETAADTVSLLLQSGFSGRAEIGLAGDDDLVIKVSDDGITWTEAMRVDASSGLPSLRYDNTGSGLAAITLHGAIDEIADAAVLGPASVGDGAPVLFDGTSGRLVKETSFAAFKAALMLTASDVGLGNVLNLRQREQLSASRTYYVRTDGSDSNDGLSNSAGGAFLTIQKAVDVVYGLDFDIYDVTIAVQSGTYTSGATFSGRHAGKGSLSLVGSGATISTTSADCFSFTNGAQVTVSGFTLQTTTAGNCINLNSLAGVTIGSGMTYGACAGDHKVVLGGAALTDTAAYTISGGAVRHVRLSRGHWTASGFTATLSGTPTFTWFLFAQLLSSVNIASVTWSGSATGTRYVASSNAVVQTYGAGASFFPGNSAGSTGTGGQYL